MLLATAAVGNYDLDRLRPVGEALELLNLGIRKHFAAHQQLNLNLITADHYYARALSTVVQLEDNYIVHRLSEALIDVSAGQASHLSGGESKNQPFTEYYKGLRKRSEFYKAASEIGIHLGGLKDSWISTLTEFSARFGMACEARHETYIPSSDVKNLAKSAHSLLINNPVPSAFTHIKEVTDALVFSEQG